MTENANTPYPGAGTVTEFVAHLEGQHRRANFQSFMCDLCGLLDLPLPDLGMGENEHNTYAFEHFIAPQRADPTIEKCYIDLYRAPHSAAVIL